MSIFSVVLKHKYTTAQLQEQLMAYDSTTAAMEGRKAEIRRQIPAMAARELMGELDKTEVKALRDLRAELAGIDLEPRAETREILAHALEAAVQDEKRLAREKLHEALGAWGKDFSVALDGAAGALQALADAIVAAQRLENNCPVRARALPGTRADETFMVGLIEALQSAGSGGLDPQRFASAISHLKRFSSKAVYFAEDALGVEHTA